MHVQQFEFNKWNLHRLLFLADGTQFFVQSEFDQFLCNSMLAESDSNFV